LQEINTLLPSSTQAIVKKDHEKQFSIPQSSTTRSNESSVHSSHADSGFSDSVKEMKNKKNSQTFTNDDSMAIDVTETLLKIEESVQIEATSECEKEDTNLENCICFVNELPGTRWYKTRVYVNKMIKTTWFENLVVFFYHCQ